MAIFRQNTDRLFASKQADIRSFNAARRCGMHKFLIAISVLSLTVGLRCDDESRIGAIEGVVTYEDGTPVRGATAYASPIDRGMAGIVPSSATDENGHFVIQSLWLGKFQVSAKKEEEGYPELTYAFNVGMTKDVALTETNPTASVSLRLGPKAGIVTGAITDAATGNLLYPCAELKWKAKPKFSVKGTGFVSDEYRVLIPPDTDILLKVWVDGYQTWFYPGVTDERFATAIRLQPGEELKLDIRMEPDSSSLVGCPAGHGIKNYPSRCLTKACPH
jgi:hypothetical protein